MASLVTKKLIAFWEACKAPATPMETSAANRIPPLHRCCAKKSALLKPDPNRAHYLIWMARGLASSTFGSVNDSTPSRNSATILV
jgi:hypothetical protein